VPRWVWGVLVFGALMEHFPSVDESFDRLHRAGWSVGEIATGAG
jgi:hypothetical protein